LRREVQNRFFARAHALKRSKLVATVLEPCRVATYRLRNCMLDLAHDLEKAEKAKTALSDRIRVGDSALLPVQEFVVSAARTSEHELSRVGETLDRLDALVLEVEQAQEAFERDFAMLDLLDESPQGLDPGTIDMLRCLSGRGGADVVSRLSFFDRFGKTRVAIQDLDEIIGHLRKFVQDKRGVVKTAVNHGIDRLQEIANWMEQGGGTGIQIAAQNTEV